jgi:hypothetical protein
MKVMCLRVRQAGAEDVYRDVIRIPEEYRLDTRGRRIPEGAVCKLWTSSASAYVILRGCTQEGVPVVKIDERQRNLLGVKLGEDAHLCLAKAGCWGEFVWAWNASDPAYRIAARLGLISALLGILGLALGLVGFLRG